MAKLALLGGKKLREKPFVSTGIMGQEEREAIQKVLDSGMLSGFIAKAGSSFLGGEYVKKLEGLAKEYFQVKHAVSVNSATAGLHVAIAACGIGPGDEVIVPPYTMCATATAIIMQNAIPIFVDIDSSCCLDPQKIEAKITPRTKAIMVVQLFGYVAQMDAIMAIARKHGLKVIEDCAQAPGAVYHGRLAGTIGDIGIFSLNQHKTITSGEGGFAVTNNDELALRMQLVRNHGEVIVNDMGVQDISGLVGYNYRMTELEAAVGLEQFKKLDALNRHRIGLAEYLTERLASIRGLTLPSCEPGNKHVYFVYPIKVNEQVLDISRDILVKALLAEGIPAGAGYVKPIYLEPMYQQKIAYGRKGCPFSCSFYTGKPDYAKEICPQVERMFEKELMVTAVCRHPHTKEDMDDVADAIKKILENKNELASFGR